MATNNVANLNVATQAIQETGTSTTSYVAPGVQQFHASATKAWVMYNMVTTTSISASYNVTSMTDNGTGDATANITNAFSSVAYAFSMMAGTGGGGDYYCTAPFTATPTASAFRGVTFLGDRTAADIAYNAITLWGDLA